jgi:hypothetical protein
MDAQDLDQFPVDSLQEFNLRTNLAQLPKQNAIANDHYSNQKGKAERQVTTDVQSIKNGASARLPHPATPEVLSRTGHTALYFKKSCADALVEAAAGRAPETLPKLFCFGTGLRLGGPVLKPVIRTNSRSNHAAASGALLWPTKTECTA